MIDFQKELNPEQLDVVLHGDGPCLVLAGAGSGKTRTITYRVAYLLEQGVKPEHILLVTFTNKAAAGMKERLVKLVCHPERSEGSLLANEKGFFGGVNPTQNDKLAILPWSGTFHHIAYRILKIYLPATSASGLAWRAGAPLLEYKNNFTVLDSDDSESIIKLCIKEFKPDSAKKFPAARVVAAIISFARNAEVALEEVLANKFSQWTDFAPELAKISHEYNKRKKESNAMDFDDLLTNFLLLLNDDKVRTKYSSQFVHILVDEYQDTNKIQASIIKKLSFVHKNVLVVGDDAQSIYSFRAADVKNILNFSARGGSASGGECYPDAKVFFLTTNYRSTEEILQVANSVIANNREQYQKELRAVEWQTPPSLPLERGGSQLSPLPEGGQKGGGSARPQLHPQVDQQSEANFIASKIEELIKSGTPENEIAVLFRAAYHSQMLEVELVRRGIDYDYRGGVRFFERAHIKDILSYLRLVNNIADAAAWLRVLMHEEGVGPVAVERVISALKNIYRLEEVPGIGREILTGKAAAGWGNFIGIWEKLLSSASNKPADLIAALLSSSYKDYLEEEYVDSRERVADIKQLLVFAERYSSLEEFLADASLQESFRVIANEGDPSPQPLSRHRYEAGSRRGGDGEREVSKPSPLRRGTEGEVSSLSSGRIVLSTIHQAKGLEWSAVFVINLSAGAFPNDRALREDGGLEEERRLFYVAITRAKKYLYLTYPMAGGSFGDFLSGPSMFLNEIESGLLEDHSLFSVVSTVLDDNDADVHYVSEDQPKKIRPGSFLIDLDSF